MFRWNLMLRTLFGSPRQQSKDRRPKLPVKPHLEALEDRTLPSTSPINPQPFIFTASPPAAPQVAALLSLADSTMQQWSHLLATLQQDVIGQLQALSQEIAQAVYAVQLQVDHIFGIDLNPAANTSSDSSLLATSASGSGSGSGVMATAYNAQDPALHKTAQPSGRGSGSSSSSGSTSGSGNASGAGIGSGSGFNTPSSSIPATAYGEVWLDNNGDGSIDNNELGYSGATVNLYLVNTDGSLSLRAYYITGSDGKYSMSVSETTDGHPYEIEVVFPPTFEATLPGVSQINAQGYTQSFTLAAGGHVQKTGGLCSMNAGTTEDDYDYEYGQVYPIQDTVTLRDAIETNNNGGGILALDDITFTNPLNGQALTGTITLQKALDTVTRGVTISGPGAGDLTIQGQGNATNPFRIFTLQAGQRVTIKGLTITGGYLPGKAGGAILSTNLVSLSGLRITKNMATYGGGIYVQGGAMTMSGGTITQNYTSGAGGLTLGGGGGIWVNSGSLTLKNNVSVGNNHADNGGYGGGMFIISPGRITISGGTFQYNHTGNNGAGIYNYTGTLTLKNNVKLLDNTAVNQGGGMWLHDGSTTNFRGCTVASNVAESGVGDGVYAQDKSVTMNGLPGGLTDNDDPGGTPVEG